MDENFDIKLGAFADGELEAHAHAEFAALVKSEPAFAAQCARLKVLKTAAQSECVADLCGSETKQALWPLIAQRQFMSATEFNDTLVKLAKAETAPAVSEQRWKAAWNNVRGRAMHSFDESHFKHAIPQIQRENWDQAWKFISTRTRLAAVQMPVQLEVVVPEPAVVTPVAHPFQTAQRSRRSQAWKWAVGLSMAAAAMLLIVFSTPRNQELPEPPSIVNNMANSMAMSIPESEDERYGVLLKYVPGSDDPIICLYDKRANSK